MGFWSNLLLRLHTVCCFKLTTPKRAVTTTCDSSIRPCADLPPELLPSIADDLGLSSIRPWADLPPELLPSIVDDLGLVDLLSFRGVCKSWRAAATASLATARVESSPGRNPWLLIHGDGIDKSRCLLLDAKNEKRCINIPEMEGATCIASTQGWLLLVKEDSVFFFCPFSRSRIDLPPLPLKLSQLSDHVAAFSSPPTSDDCIVCLPNRNKASGLELFLLSRRSSNWTKHVLGFTNQDLGSINCATFYKDGNFWLLDKGSGSVSFCPRNKQGLNYRRVAPHLALPNNPKLPFGFYEGCIKSCKKHIMDWFAGSGNKNGASVSTCGTMVQRSNRSDAYVLNETEGRYSSSRLKAIWLHPRFYELPEHQSWTLRLV